MATLIQVISTIRFELGQLSSLNKQHDFEHLCRYLARARICSNILPATGPVSAGGDQGRDFETFRTYLSASPISNSSFVGLASGQPITFACTTTGTTALVSKIKSDIATIMKSGEKVFDIHYFCTEDLAISRRHRLQQWAKTNYSIQLEIYDGHAISELLADRDTFSIAENFLGIPAELYPPAPVDPENKWYQESLTVWKNPDHTPDNYADFSQIKSALRHSTYTESVRTHVSFWIGVMHSLASHTPMAALKRKAIYEIAVANLRGLGSLFGFEQQLRDYFSAIPSLSGLSDIEDANVLLTFCIGAHRQDVLQIPESELSIWLKHVIDKIESELKLTQNPDRRCTLIRDRAHRYLMPGPKDEDAPDINSALQCWLELVSIADQTHLFPLDNFSDELTNLMALPLAINEHPDFHKVTQRIDELLEKRFGGFTAAEKCRNRAITLYDQGKILQALNEIHTAKIKWFADETLKGSILSTLFAVRCYHELGLAYAAKYYALIASYMVLNSSDESLSQYAAQALVEVASSDHLQGAYCGFFDFSDLALNAYRAFSGVSRSPDSINEIERTVFHSTIVRIISQHLAPEFFTYVCERIAKWEGLEEMFGELVPLAEKEWAKVKPSELWTKLENEMLGRPFSDVGSHRTLRFTALGITWDFNWDNTYELTATAEEFLAVLQIILADFAGVDLCLMRTTVNITVELHNGNNILVQPVPSNTQTKYIIKIPSTMALQYEDAQLFGTLSAILSDVSLLPRDKYMKHLELSLQKGLSGKTFFIQEYTTLYRRFIQSADFDASARKAKSVPNPDFKFQPKLQNELEWFSGPGLGYSHEASIELLKNRYKNSILSIRHTLPRLLQDPTFKQTVASLKKEAWLDWHVLTAVAMATVNYRVNKKLHPSKGVERYQRLFMDTLYQEEDPSLDSVPIAEFDKDKLKFHLFSSMCSTLIGNGLEMHQRTPDFNAISDFLGQRYNYWTDDITHADFGF